MVMLKTCLDSQKSVEHLPFGGNVFGLGVELLFYIPFGSMYSAFCMTQLCLKVFLPKAGTQTSTAPGEGPRSVPGSSSPMSYLFLLIGIGAM